MRFFRRGETVDSRFIFLDSETNEPIDINTPLYKITHFEGPTQVIDVPEGAITKVAGETGQYIVNWVIPNDAIEDETYYITATGIHPTDSTLTVLEDFFRIVSEATFGGGGGGGLGRLVAKFTKP